MYFDFPERILMPKIKLKEGMRISLQNTLYDVIAIPSQGEVVISDVVSGEQQPINVEAVLAAYASGQLTVPLLKAQVNQRKQREHPLVGSNYDPPALTKTFRRLSAAPDKVGKPSTPTRPSLITLIDAYSRLLAGFAFIHQGTLEIHVHKTYSPKTHVARTPLDTFLLPMPPISPQPHRR